MKHLTRPGGFIPSRAKVAILGELGLCFMTDGLRATGQ
jgi:hypothetical protein